MPTEVMMKLHKPKKNHDIKDRVLEEVLNSLPNKELPTFVEERILAAIRDQNPLRTKPHPGASQRLQWVAVSVGAFVFMSLGALMAKSVTSNAKPVNVETEHKLDIYDPSLLDYVEILGG